jgi:hypothetical protein
MTVERCFAFALVTALLGAIAGQAAELPAQNAQRKKPKQAEAVRRCDIAGSPGILAPDGVCVRMSGNISTGVSTGQLR